MTVRQLLKYCKRTLKQAAFWIFIILYIAALPLLYGAWGVWGIVLGISIIVAYALYRLWLFRDHVINTMRTIEMMIWGRPLDKEEWDKGELRKTKAFEWKKQNDERT